MLFKAKIAVMETMHQDVPAEVVERVVVTEPIPALVREPVPVPDASVEVMPSMSDRLRDQYLALAKDLGVTQPGLERDAARAYFAAQGTRLYDAAKVKAYLDGQYGPETRIRDYRFSNEVFRERPTWCWRPLRNTDVVPVPDTQREFYSTPQMNDAIWGASTSYAKPLPLPVLLTVKDVAAAFPTARFYVSDEVYSNEHRDPVLDPFLLVVIETERFIIERWDEPGYRE